MNLETKEEKRKKGKDERGTKWKDDNSCTCKQEKTKKKKKNINYYTHQRRLCSRLVEGFGPHSEQR